MPRLNTLTEPMIIRTVCADDTDEGNPGEIRDVYATGPDDVLELRCLSSGKVYEIRQANGELYLIRRG